MKHSVNRGLGFDGSAFAARFRRAAWTLLILSLPLWLGAWRDLGGKTINPRFVERIQNGQTTKHEILLWFGDPDQVERSPEGPVFRYVSYKDGPPPPGRETEREKTPAYYLDDQKQVKKLVPKTKGKIVRSTLTVRFRPDGEKVLSHEYKEFDDNR